MDPKLNDIDNSIIFAVPFLGEFITCVPSISIGVSVVLDELGAF